MQVHFDRFAILLSGICAIHCVALPIIASLIPLLSVTIQHGHALHEFWFHQLIILFILPVSVIALVTGYRSHFQLIPVIVASIGLLILVAVTVSAEYLISHHVMPYYAETIGMIIGGIIHAIGHVLNLLAARKLNKSCTAKGPCTTKG